MSRQPGELSSALGWRFFAGIMLLLLGIMNLIDGLTGIMDSDLFEKNLGTAPNLPATNNLVAWGWVVLIVGIVMIAIAFPVMGGLSWGRFAGIAIAGIDLLLQFAFLAHFPLWSLVLVFLNALVIYGLATHGDVPVELERR